MASFHHSEPLTAEAIVDALTASARSSSLGREPPAADIAVELKARQTREPDDVGRLLAQAMTLVADMPVAIAQRAWHWLNIIIYEVRPVGHHIAATASNLLSDAGNSPSHVRDPLIRTAAYDTLVAVGVSPSLGALLDEYDIRSEQPAQWLRLAIPQSPIQMLERLFGDAIRGLVDNEPARSRLTGQEFARALPALRQKCQRAGEDFPALALRLFDLLPREDQLDVIERSDRSYGRMFSEHTRTRQAQTSFAQYSDESQSARQVEKFRQSLQSEDMRAFGEHVASNMAKPLQVMELV